MMLGLALWLVLAVGPQDSAAVVQRPAVAVAEETELDRVAREVSSGLRCPVCQGTSVQDSPAELAVEMKTLVREQLAAGKTPEEVRSYFVTKYGEWVLLEPKASGFNLLVYVLPLLIVVAGGWTVWRFVSRHGPMMTSE